MAIAMELMCLRFRDALCAHGARFRAWLVHITQQTPFTLQPGVTNEAICYMLSIITPRSHDHGNLKAERSLFRKPNMLMPFANRSVIVSP